MPAALGDDDGPHEDLWPLRRDALSGDVVAVAPALLGHLIVANDITARIVEVEAYGGHDPASHAFRGPTPRNAPMFAQPGTAYLYLSHGLHWCLNVVAEPAGTPAAVLVRAAVVEQGVLVAAGRRGLAVPRRQLMRGPGNVAKALGLDGSLSGGDLIRPLGDGPTPAPRPSRPRPAGDRAGGPAWLARDAFEPGPIQSGPRVGVRLAADRPWRFWLTGYREVSTYRRHPRATVTPDERRGPSQGTDPLARC